MDAAFAGHSLEKAFDVAMCEAAGLNKITCLMENLFFFLRRPDFLKFYQM